MILGKVIIQQPKAEYGHYWRYEIKESKQRTPEQIILQALKARIANSIHNIRALEKGNLENQHTFKRRLDHSITLEDYTQIMIDDTYITMSEAESLIDVLTKIL